MRRVFPVVGIVIVVAIGLVWWLRGRDESPATAPAVASKTGRAAPRASGPRIPAIPATVS